VSRLVAIAPRLFGSPGSIPAVTIGGSAAVFGFGLVTFSVTAAGVRQVLAPEASRGRVMATLRFFEWGVMPVGSVVGGLVGEAAGPSAALAVAAFVFASASV
jgi:hypothetical protein